MVSEAPSTQRTDYSNIITSQYLAQSYAMVMTTQPVLEVVAEKLGMDKENAGMLQGMIQVEQIQDTQLMRYIGDGY